MKHAIRGFSQVNRSLINTMQYAKQPQLYIHEFSPSKTTISFSEDPNKLHIGSLTKSLTTQSTAITPKIFVENKPFYKALHETYAKYAHLDQTYILDALNYPGSYMALGDYKVVLDYMNQRPELVNTVGFVHVDFDCQINPSSYEANEMYNLCNIDGIITLSEFMLNELKQNL